MPSSCLKILQFAEGFSPSHMLFNYRLAKSLTSSGHDVTLITVEHFLNLSNSAKQVPHGVVEHIVPSSLSADIMKQAEESFQVNAFQEDSFLSLIIAFFFIDWSEKAACEKTLTSRNLINMMKQGKFDLVLSPCFDYCPLFISHSFEIPAVWHSAVSGLIESISISMRIPSVPSYVPNVLAVSGDSMSFLERIWNLIYHWINIIQSNVLSYWQNNAFNEFNPSTDKPDTWALRREIDLQLISGELWLEFPRPLIRGLSYLGEIGVVEMKSKKGSNQLDPAWEKIVNSRPGGFILFSLGSVANTTRMPDAMVKGMTEALSRFSDYSIIWRLEKDAPGVEKFKHIHIVQWTPQSMLLAHPKIRLFITHCGYNSFLETVHAAVPMLALPLWADQIVNAQKAARLGIGLSLNKMKMKQPDIIESAMKTLLKDSKYRSRARAVSSMLKDRFIDPNSFLSQRLQSYSKMNWHNDMKAAQSLNFLQYHCMDVILAACIVTVLHGYVLFRLICVIRRVLSKRPK